MKNYPLGSFPRFGYQNQRAQERRQRAIANSIATRRQKKWLRENPNYSRELRDAIDDRIELEKKEREFFNRLRNGWLDLTHQIGDSKPPSDALREEAIWIANKVKEIDKQKIWWRSNIAELGALFDRMNLFAENWNREKNNRLLNPPKRERPFARFFYRISVRIRYQIAIHNW